MYLENFIQLVIKSQKQSSILFSVFFMYFIMAFQTVSSITEKNNIDTSNNVRAFIGDQILFGYCS